MLTIQGVQPTLLYMGHEYGRQELEGRLVGDAWFGGIPAAHRRLLLGQLRQRHTHAGERIYAFGAAPDGLYVVIEGEVRLVSYPRVGKQVLHLVLSPPSWFGEVSVLDDGRYTWEGGFGTAWSNVPSQDLTVVVLTQRAADETGMPAVCADVLSAACSTS